MSIKIERNDGEMKVELIEKKMKEKNLSILKLSKMIDADDRSLGLILNGKTRNPRIDTVIKIANVLDFSIYEFAQLCDYKTKE